MNQVMIEILFENKFESCQDVPSSYASLAVFLRGKVVKRKAVVKQRTFEELNTQQRYISTWSIGTDQIAGNRFICSHTTRILCKGNLAFILVCNDCLNLFMISRKTEQ